MKKENPKYPGIYLAENIIDYHGQIGIIRLSFPRCIHELIKHNTIILHIQINFTH